MRSSGRVAFSSSARLSSPKSLLAVSWRRPCVRRCARLVLCLVVAVGCLPLAASGQEYKTAPVNERLRVAGRIAQNYAKAPTGIAADRERFDEYFSEYYFPAMTRHDPEGLEELGDMRFDLFRNFIWATPSEPLQHDLTDMAYEEMLKIVGNPGYHPAVRYNAILVLGMLDDEYAIEIGADRRPPKPYAKANAILIKAAEADRIPPPLLVGALIGLERHAMYHESLGPEAVSGMTGVALKIVNLEKRPPDVDRDVFAWIKLKAASVLAELGAVGQGNEVHQALMKLIADGNLSLNNRCHVAGLLGNINYEGAKLNDPAAVEPLVQLAVEVSKTEAKNAREFERMYTGEGRTSTSRSRREYRSSYGEEEALERRQLLARLTNLRDGLAAVKPALAGQQQARIEAIVAAIEPVVSVVEDEDTVDLAVTAKVRTMRDEIQDAARIEAAPTADEPPAGES